MLAPVTARVEIGADERFRSLLPGLPRQRTRLLDNLVRIRREVGPLTPERCDALADHMGIRRGEVAEVVSFYSYLRLPLDCLRICTGPVCDCLGARELLAQAEDLARGALPVVEVPCLGHCDVAPVGTRGDTVLPRLDGALLERALAGGATPSPVRRTNDGPSLGLAQPDGSLADYERRGGLQALRALPNREQVLAELEASGLVGYGGAGFPVHRKWAAILQRPRPRVVIVNADEGEPGTIKDRYLLELRPHLVVEGMLIAARFAEAERAIVYIREEYALARARLQEVLAEFSAAGLLEGIAVEVVSGAGSYVCGEETALLESLEGRRGMPRLRPPFPAQAGYLGLPTLINNVETLAHVPAILRRGGAWFAGLGRNGAKGVRLWSISGAVARPGCYEAPNGITLRELIESHAGGAREEIGAVVPGGAASGVLPPAALDVPLTREALAAWGCSPGSAGVQVFPAGYPLLRLLRETMRFFAEESCQKCTPCRIGTRALGYLLAELEAGRAAMSRERLEQWLWAMERGSICGLGQAAPLPLRAAMRHWPQVFACLR
jgi:NADH:ubiquinone oxidoreductase subunit F (NADH-binding)/NADH:ubiquinone oxidoreductase subunit E